MAQNCLSFYAMFTSNCTAKTTMRKVGQYCVFSFKFADLSYNVLVVKTQLKYK